MDGLRCIDDFTTSCLDDDHRAYFNTLYTGTTQVIMDLCQTGQYQTGERLTWQTDRRLTSNWSFLLRIPPACSLYERRPDWVRVLCGCLSTEDQSIKQGRPGHHLSYISHHSPSPSLLQGEIATPSEEDDNVQVLCCSFQRYLHCSEQVVNSTCGAGTAGFTKKFLDRMSGPLVQQHCQHYEYGSEMCPSKPGPESEQAPYSSLPGETAGAINLSAGCLLLALTFVLTKLF